MLRERKMCREKKGLLLAEVRKCPPVPGPPAVQQRAHRQELPLVGLRSQSWSYSFYFKITRALKKKKKKKKEEW